MQEVQLDKADEASSSPEIKKLHADSRNLFQNLLQEKKLLIQREINHITAPQIQEEALNRYQVIILFSRSHNLGNEFLSYHFQTSRRIWKISKK